MNRVFHCVLVGLVSLLTIILVAFLLLFTDVSFSPAEHLANGNTWTAKRLKLSAELAYYNYWRDPAEEIHNKESMQLSGDENLKNQQGQVSSNKTASSLKDNVSHRGQEVGKSAQTVTTPSQGAESMVALNSHLSQLRSNVETRDTLLDQFYHTNDRDDSDKNDGGADVKSDILNSTSVVDLKMVVEWEEEESLLTNKVEEGDREEGYESDEMKDEMEEAEDIESVFLSEMEEQRNIEKLASNSNSFLQNGNVKINDTHLNKKNAESPTTTISPSLMARSTDTNFHMPCRKVYKPVSEIVMASWMKPLLRILSSLEGKQVTLVIANNAYRDVLLNWLISAKIVSKPPLENIIVVCLDNTLHRLLQSRDIASIVAPFSTVLNAKHHFKRFFELIMMMRLGFMRLINRLGYDCAMYDIDAIILKNPQPLYEKWGGIDIIGSRGELPRELWRRWGVTICIGAVFIRSNSRTELYWEAMYSAKTRAAGMANDQIRLNYGLHALNTQWDYDKTRRDTPAVGHSSRSNLSVVVLPFSTICRFGCRANMRGQYYIWHKGGSRDKQSKMKGAKQGHTWFLKDKWSELHSNMIVDVKGTKWLKRISVHT